MQFLSLKVIGLKQETEDTVTIEFKQPALKKVKYKAGQYLTLVFRINGRRYIRPYSFSSAPGVDANLEVTVKRVPGGVVSNHIIDKVQIGDIVEVMQPLGDFTLDEENVTQSTHIVLWGAGSGITPLMSIAKYALKQGIAGHVTLVYGNRNAESVIFKDSIASIEKEFSNFKSWHFHTQPTVSTDNPYLVQGRINPDKVLSVMKAEGKLENTVHYICGPSGLKQSVKEALSQLGISAEAVHSEDFEVVRNPSDFEDVSTQTVSILKDGITTAVEVPKGRSVLEAGLDALIELPYSCQTGNCLVCRGRLISGELKTIGVDKLPDGLGANEHLLCSSFPLTDNILIEVPQ